MENNNKKGKGLIIVVIVLLIILIGLVGFDIYKNVNNKENSTNKEETKTEMPKLTKDSLIVQHLIKVFFTDNVYEHDMIKELDSYKDYYTLKSLILRNGYENIECNKLSRLNYGNMVCGFDGNKYYYEDIIDSNNKLIASDKIKKQLENSSTNFISKNEFDKEIKRLYGDNANFKYPNEIYYNCAEKYYYDNKLSGYAKYNLASFGCGEGTDAFEYRFIDIDQDGNKLTFIVNEINSAEEKEIIVTYKYNFELDKNGNYIFVDAVKEK